MTSPTFDETYNDLVAVCKEHREKGNKERAHRLEDALRYLEARPCHRVLDDKEA